MKVLKGQYINLADGSSPNADPTEVKFSLDSQIIQLGGGRRCGWIWYRPCGIVLEKGRDRTRGASVDFTPLLQALIYGVSLLLAAIGVLRRYASPSQSGELNGG